MKTTETTEARRLRRGGGSISEIASTLGVAKSSVSRWVKDIQLTEPQIAALTTRNRRFGAQNLGAAANARNGRARRVLYQEQGRHRARVGDTLFVAGVMLYWGEGDKGSRHVAHIANSDVELLRLFGRFVRTTWPQCEERLRARVHLFAETLDDQRHLENFWLEALHLPRTALQRSVVNYYSSASRRKRVGVLPHGTCRFSVNSTEVVQAIYGAIQELGGFDRPVWLG